MAKSDDVVLRGLPKRPELRGLPKSPELPAGSVSAELNEFAVCGGEPSGYLVAVGDCSDRAELPDGYSNNWFIIGRMQ